MKITKHDLEAIAKQVRSALANTQHYYRDGSKSDYENGVGSATVAIAMYFKAANKNFDRDKFLKDCGL